MLRQLADDPPLAFVTHGVSGLDAVERVLLRALAKDPAERFETVAALGEAYRRALRGLEPQTARPETPRRAHAETLLDDVVQRVGLTGELLQVPLEAPTASLQNGAAGFAYALLRIAALREDEELLALADVWSQRALQAIGDASAFTNEELEITPATFGTRSLYHCETGVHWTDALIASARWDDVATAVSVDAFVRCVRPAHEHDDLAFGPAATLSAARFSSRTSTTRRARR